jgi:RHS repeat-associated protein
MEQKSGVTLRAAWAPPARSLPIEWDLLFQWLAIAAPIGLLALLAWLGVHEVVVERPVTAGLALGLSVFIAVPPHAWAMGGGSGGGTTWVRYMFHDHLGSEVLATDTGGHTVERRVFGPFGDVIDSQIARRAPVPASFTGKLYYHETDVYNFGARWYDPEAGRFVSVDPILQSIIDPQTHNPYTYVRNNPIGNVDPDGREFSNNDRNNNLGAFVAFALGGLSGIFGGGSKKPSPPSTPHGTPASGRTVVDGNTGGSTKLIEESTPKNYEDESQRNQGFGQIPESFEPFVTDAQWMGEALRDSPIRKGAFDGTRNLLPQRVFSKLRNRLFGGVSFERPSPASEGHHLFGIDDRNVIAMGMGERADAVGGPNPDLAPRTLFGESRDLSIWRGRVMPIVYVGPRGNIVLLGQSTDAVSSRFCVTLSGAGGC